MQKSPGFYGYSMGKSMSKVLAGRCRGQCWHARHSSAEERCGRRTEGAHGKLAPAGPARATPARFGTFSLPWLMHLMLK